MFKLESYVAPLLIGYIDKYVKLNKDDFQMSLWGGDVVLNKLELRLDAIEKLIKLPISLRSGWIHELRVHVPWTHLYSDPVVITINTIECSVTLKCTDKNNDFENLSRRLSSSNNNTKCMTKIESPEDLPLSGYLQSLLNKIVNNINIVVNNLILKFVDEDIVLSLNIKSAECYSTDSEWHRSFIDLIPEDLTIRRVLDIHDLTLCLDKRNASGKIEHYQAPVLYKCMLTLRLALIYESLFFKLPWMTKLNVVCDLLNVSMTDVQLPMFQRLLRLFSRFYYGSPNSSEYFQEVKEDAEEVKEDEGIKGLDNQSWISWAWSYVPPIFSYTHESDLEGFKCNKNKDVFLIIGFHVRHMHVHLKHSVLSQAKGLGFDKMIFMPYILVNFKKLSLDIRLKGHSFVDIQFGISNMKSYYHCNCMDFLSDEEVWDTMNIQFFMGGENMDSHEMINCFHKSLFDDDYEIESFPTLEEEHILMFTEDYARKNFGFFWMNIFLTSETREDSIRVGTSRLSVLDLNEKSLFRLFVGKSELIFSSRLFEILQQFFLPLMDSISSNKHDTEEIRQVADEDLSRLELNAVTCRYFVSLLQPSIYLYPYSTIPIQHKCFEINKNESLEINSPKCMKAGTPVTIAACERLDLNFSMPQYPRLLSSTCSIQSTLSEQAMRNCHSVLFIQVNKLNVYLKLMDYLEYEEKCVFHLESFRLHQQSLLYCNLWNNLLQMEKDLLLEGDNLTLYFTKPQFLIISYILGSWIFQSANDNVPCSLSLLNDAFHGKNSLASLSLEITIPSLEIHYLETKSAHAISGCITTILILMIGLENEKQFLLPLLYGPLDLSKINSGKEFFSDTSKSFNKEITGDLVSFSFQIQKNSVFNTVYEGVFIKILGISFLLDPVFYDWMSYIPKQPIYELEQSSWLNSEIAFDTDPLSSSYFGSESDATNIWHNQLSMIYNLFKYLEVKVIIENCCFFLSSQRIYPISPVVDIPAMIHSLYISKNLPDILVIVSPAISVTSFGTPSHSEIPPIPIRITKQYITGEKFPWKLILKGMSGYSLHGCKIVIEFLESIIMTLTMALNVTCKEFNYVQDMKVSLCLHCDIDVAHIFMSSEQIDLFGVLLNKLRTTVNDHLETFHYMKEMLNVESCNFTKHVPEPSLGSSNLMSVSNNLEPMNISEIMSEHLSLDFRDEQNCNANEISLWLQFTISKLLLEFIDISTAHKSSIFLCEIADLTNSLDLHETYINLKSKINSISIKRFCNHQEIPFMMSGVILPHYLIHVLTSKNSRGNISHFQNSCLKGSTLINTEFLTFVFTRIYDIKSIDRFVNKYESKKSQGLTFGISCLDEICLVLQPLVVIFDFESILSLIKLLDMMNILLSNGNKKCSQGRPDGPTFVSMELPLIHLNMKAVYMFVNESNGVSSSFQTSKLEERLEDTIVIYVHSFDIIPYADNPLPRLVVDKNIYARAVKLGMFGFIPGYQFEDRQYQACIHGITIASICWENVCEQTRLRSDSLISGNVQNPAFEWNSNMRSNEIFHVGLLMPCTDIQIIFAPAIVNHEKQLVCGYSIEINATSEIEICLTSSQIKLLIGLISAVIDLSHCQSWSKNTFEEDSLYKPEDMPSFIVPFDILVTGIRLNVFIFMNVTFGKTNLFDYCHHPSKFIVKPVICFLISQPHLLIKYDKINLKSRFEISCYDACIKSGNPMSSHAFNPVIGSQIFNLFPSYSDFPNFLMETKQGKVHTITGVLSSLCTCTINDFHSQVKTDIKIERPVLFSYNEDHVEMFLLFFDKLSESLHFYGYKLKDEPYTSETDGKLSSKYLTFQNLIWIENTSLYTTQCVFQWFVKIGESQRALKFSTKNIDFCVHGQSGSKLSCEIKISNLAFTLLSSDAMFFMFGPTTIEGLLSLSSHSIYMVHENPCPLVIPSIDICLHCDMILLQFTKESLTCLNDILHHFLSLDSKKHSSYTSVKSEINFISLNFENDLISDGFSFVQNEENGLPASGEIKFQKGANHSSITWKYHEPRAINKLMVTPIPFEIGEEIILEHYQEFKRICCILQYSLDNGVRFNDYFPFEVGKNVLVEVPLPSFKDYNFVVSCLWRVLLKKDSNDYDSRVFQNIENNNFIKRNKALSPLVLTSCFIINSSIIPQMIHTVTINASFNKLEAIFKYTRRNLKEISVVENCNVLPDHRMAVLNCLDSSICFQTLLIDFSRSRMNIVSKLECSILEYSSLTWLKIIQGMVIIFNVSFDKEVPKLEVACIINRCYMTISQEVVHSLDVLYNFWKELSYNPHIISSYLILNNTQEEVYFGQNGTEETICLQSQNLYQYFWDHRCRKKELWFGINKPQDDSNILSLERTDLLKKIKLFDGRILFVHLNDYFKLQIGGNLTFGSNLDFDAFINIELEGISIFKKLNAFELLPSFAVNEKELGGLKMRISCDDLKTWSEEIILGHASKKYLLKTNACNKDINLWCEILIQNKYDANMCLVLFTPIFILKSHYPSRLIMNASLSESSDDLHISVAGKGRSTCFHCVYSLPIDITFQLSPELSASSPVFSISSHMVKNTFAKIYNVDLDLDHIINDWKNEDCTSHWPYNALDVSVLSSTQIRSINDNCADFNIPTPNIELSVSLHDYASYSNTVLVEITPQWMIINETNLDLIITNFECSEMWRFSSSNVLVPPIMNQFIVILSLEGRSHNSRVIKLLSDELSGQYQPNVDACLALDSHAILVIPITHSNKIIKQIHMTIHSTWKFNMRIITIRERFVFVNNIPYNVLLHCLCSTDQVEMDKSILPLPTVWIDKCLNNVEVVQPMLMWNFCENEESFSHIKFWLCMKLSKNKESDDMDWSFPVCLEVGSETSCHHVIVNVAHDEKKPVKSVPCCLTVQVMKGLIYLVLDFELYAYMRVHNNCNFLVYLAVPLYSKVIRKNIYTKVVAIEANSSEYFCPLLNTKSINFFPFVVVIGYHDFIISNIVWSKPLEIYENLNSVIKLGNSNVKIELEVQGLIPHMRVNTIIRANIVTVEKVIHKESVHQLHSKHNHNVFLPKLIAHCDHRNESFWCGFKINVAVVCRNMLCLFKDDLKQRFLLDELDNNIKSILLVAMDDIFISVKSNLDEKLCNSIYQFDISIGDFQLDNKAFDDGTFDFPVVILRSQEGYSYKKLKKKCILNDIFKYRIENVFLKVFGTFVLEPKFQVLELGFTFSPIAICLEDTFVFKVMEFIYSFRHILKFHKAKTTIYLTVPPDIRLISNDFANTIRLKKLTIEPIKVLISFHASVKIFLALDSTPFSFGKFENENMWLTKQQLSKLLTLHYASGALLRTGVVIGSLEILGNPTGFVRSISNGIYDMIYLPYNGLTLGPTSCLAGFSNGIKSIVKHVSTGTLTSISNFASGISRNMERLSMDKDHINIFERMRRRKSQGLTQGIFDGLSGFGLSLLGAIAGIADQPLQVFMAPDSNNLSTSAKARGVISGFGKGLIGIFAKPIGGAAELVSRTSIGFMQEAGLMKVYQQKNWQMFHLNEFQSNFFDKIILSRNDVINFDREELLFCLDNCSLNSSVVCLIILTSSVIHIWNCSDDLLICSYPLTDVHLSVDHKSNELFIFISSIQDEGDDLLLKSDNKWVMDYISKKYFLQTDDFGASSPAIHESQLSHSTKLKLKYRFNFCDKHKADTLLCLIDYVLCSKDMNNFF